MTKRGDETQSKRLTVTTRREDRLLPARWPDAAEASQARWFQPIRIGPLRAEARTWVPAMVPWRASPDGFVTDAVIAWYERFARGRPAVLVVEATGIRDVPSGPLLRASHDRYIEGLSRLVRAVKTASKAQTLVFIQLIDFLAIKRRPVPAEFIRRFLKLTPALRSRLPLPLRDASDDDVREGLVALPLERLSSVLDAREFEALTRGLRERVTDTQLPHVAALPATLPTLFADAARRCAQAGFDGIELHYAHAYTMASFLSALNTRSDGYGGERAHRVRLPLEVYAKVRAAVPASLAVGCRFLANEIVDGGSSRDDISYFAVEFARAGVDFLSLSRGGKFEDARQPKVGHAAYPYTGISGHECMPTTTLDFSPWSRNRSDVARIRRAVRDAGYETPIVLCGGIATFDQAEEILAAQDADLVASARQSLADPDWFDKVRSGRGGEVRRCLFTNYCEGLDQAHQPVTCQLWDRQKNCPDDATVMRTSNGRRLVAPD